MNRTVFATIAACLILGFSTPIFADVDERIADSRAVIKSFAGELQTALKGAMQSGGPLEAIAVCNELAPAIAARHGQERNWEVGRTSLKYRNPENEPDDWEAAVLRSFETRKSQGEDPKAIEYSEFVEMDGETVFRYMKAIPTGNVCLNCHGGDMVEPAVEAKIAEFYPNDKARGYSVGDIRGAFTIVQPVE